MQRKNKIGRNDKCPCGSSRKYKVCCLKGNTIKEIEEKEKYTGGHNFTSENIKKFAEHVKEEYEDFKAIDVTDYLTPENYEQIQLRNFNRGTFVMAEKNETNMGVFIGRAPEGYNFMVMYNGAYRCFDFKNFERAKSNIYDMFAKAHGIETK